MSKKELIDIFGEDLLEKKELLDTLKELSGIYENKPFECVGSRDEVIVALNLTIEKYKKEKEELPYLLKYFSEQNMSGKNDKKRYVNFFDKKNHLPPEFKTMLINELKEQLGYVSKD